MYKAIYKAIYSGNNKVNLVTGGPHQPPFPEDDLSEQKPLKMVVSKFGISKLPGVPPIFRGDFMLDSGRVPLQTEIDLFLKFEMSQLVILFVEE